MLETRRESPLHLLVLSGESLADSRSRPNDRTCLTLAVVDCQARTVWLFVNVQPCSVTKQQCATMAQRAKGIIENHIPDNNPDKCNYTYIIIDYICPPNYIIFEF